MGWLIMILLCAILFYAFSDVLMMLALRLLALSLMVAIAAFCHRGLSSFVLTSGMTNQAWIAHVISLSALLILCFGILRWMARSVQAEAVSDGAAVALDLGRVSLVFVILLLLLTMFGVAVTGQLILSSLIVQLLFVTTFSCVDVCFPTVTCRVARMVA